MKLLNNLKDKKKQGGYNMVELLLVMAVIVTLTAILIMGLYSAASNQSHEHETVAQVSNMVQSVRAYVSSSDSANPVNDVNTGGKPGGKLWKQMGSYGLDLNIRNKSGKNVNPFGGSYTIATAKTPGQFSIKIDTLPSRAVADTKFLADLGRQGNSTGAAGKDAGNQDKCTGTNGTITCTYDY